MSSFLGGVGTFTNIIFAILPTGPSIEEQLLENLQEGFGQVNLKIDQVLDEMGALKAYFEFLLVGQTFRQYKINILAANRKLSVLANISILISELELINTTTPAPTSAPAPTPVTASTSIPITTTPNDLEGWKITYQEKLDGFVNFCNNFIEDIHRTGYDLTSEDIFRKFNSAEGNDRGKLLNLGKTITGQARLIRSHSSARFCFELSGNSN